METLTQMTERHLAEVKELQENCTHPHMSNWIEETHSPCRYTGCEVKYCEICRKELARRLTTRRCYNCGAVTEHPMRGIGTRSRPWGAWYCEIHGHRSEQEITADNSLLTRSIFMLTGAEEKSLMVD